jgi:hypothetical protein
VNCDFCDTPTGPIFVTDHNEDICARCLDNKETREAEAAHERSLSTHYGGDCPQTVQERYQAAAEQKRRLG